MQKINSHQVAMTAILEEIMCFREMEQTRQEVASKPKRQFSNELGGQYSDSLRGAGEFHRLPMQAKVRYLPPHKKEGGTLENVVGERPNATRTTTPQRIFYQTNPITQPRVYEGGFSFNGGPRGIMQPPARVATMDNKYNKFLIFLNKFLRFLNKFLRFLNKFLRFFSWFNKFLNSLLCN